MAENTKERVLVYEIQTLQNGRWEIHSRFPADAKESALDEAKSLEEHAATSTVKVIKEVYNTQTNKSDEFTVYKTDPNKKKVGASAKTAAAPSAETPKPKKKAPPPKKASGTKRRQKTLALEKQAEQEVEEALNRKNQKKAKPPPSILRVMFKLFLTVIISVGIALAVSKLGGFALQNADTFGYYVNPKNRTSMVFAIFVLGFLLSSIPLTIYFLTNENLNFQFGGPRRASQPSKAMQKSARAARKSGISLEDRLEAERRVAEVISSEGRVPEDDEEPDEKPKPEVAPKPPVLDSWGTKQKNLVMKFLDDNLTNVGPTANLDNYNKFGVNLFLAGACEALATERELDIRATSHILAEAVQTMGFKRGQAQSFADKYQDYLLADQRYMKMFQAGRGSIEPVLSGESPDSTAMQKALADWNKPKDEADTSQIVTVMFTDMVGSTAMTQILGDEGAQKVVRAHNTIVRQALAHNRGKEVKHTGDGIMASFTSTTDGVKAAIQILQQALRHNKKTPELPLRLKIGLHSGQAIAEDDDLFGTHVQLAARIVDKAGESEIFVSETAHGICAGSNLRFINKGKFELKGFNEPQTVYLAQWDGQEEATEIAQTFKAQAAEAIRRIKDEEAKRKAEEEAALRAEEDGEEPPEAEGEAAEGVEEAAAMDDENEGGTEPSEETAEAATTEAAPEPAAVEQLAEPQAAVSEAPAAPPEAAEKPAQPPPASGAT